MNQVTERTDARSVCHIEYEGRPGKVPLRTGGREKIMKKTLREETDNEDR